MAPSVYLANCRVLCVLIAVLCTMTPGGQTLRCSEHLVTGIPNGAGCDAKQTRKASLESDGTDVYL